MSSGFVGPQAFERLADAALDVAGDASLEVLIQRSAEGLTRFANSNVHQNVWSEQVEVSVRAVLSDGRVGVAKADTDDPALAAVAARDAVALAGHAPANPDFAGLAPPAETTSVPVDQATATATPQDRAAAVRAALAEVADGYEAAGAYSTAAAELGVYNSLGQRAYTPLSSAQMTIVVAGPSSSGYAEEGGRASGDFDPAVAARRAVAKARASADPVAVDAGDWPVVLEPAAAGTLVQFLGLLAGGGKAFVEGRSVAARRMGEQVADSRVTIVDDALSPDTIGYSFDFEGTPKRRVELLSDGVLAGVVHDRDSAAKAGAESTGHALPAPNSYGALPLNPLMSAGDGGSIDDLVAGCERGLLVTRFHYTNVVHQLETSITGMTRDGTFLVEDGQIRRGVRNLRFTQSILAALSQVDAISAETAYASELFSAGSRCPALRLKAFTFTGTTTYA